jgi:dTDP-4-amino-4,6-dideoxygalactose transaminase
MALDRTHLSPPHMSPRDRELLLDAFDSNWIAPLGPHVSAFEQEFAEKVGTKSAVALSSGTGALHLAMKLVGVEPGDDVLVSTFTFSATANAVTYCGANPIFIGSESKSWNICPQLLEDELAERAKTNRLPKAVVTVDLYGQCCDYDPILAICNRYDVPLIEDAAEALGASYGGKSAGQFGKIAIFSFNGNKIITTSSGGMLVTDNEAWAEKARFWATQSRDPAPHYQHSEIGYNYRMSNLLAAVGRGQLSVLDERVAARRANFDFYRDHLGGLPGIEFMPEPDGYFSTRWLTCLTIDPSKFGATQEDVRLALEAENIESRPLRKPMPLPPIFAKSPHRGNGFSEHLFETGLCLPSGSALAENDLERIATLIQQCSLYCGLSPI